MKRLVLAACLLLPGLAAAQDGGGLVINTPVPIDWTPEPFYPIVIPPIDFDPIVIRPVDMSGALWGQQLQPMARALAPVSAGVLLGEAPLLTLEEEGVRMPDQQFTLPPETKP